MGTLALVRHGQASAFAENYDRLSSLGELQSRLLGDYFRHRGITFDRVFCGPLVRQRRTAEIVVDAARLPAPVVLDGFDEMRVEPLFAEQMPEIYERHGHLRTLGDAMVAAEGNAAKGRAFARLFGATLHLWMQGQIAADDLEPWAVFQERVRNAIAAAKVDGGGAGFAGDGRSAKARSIGRGKRILVVTSGGVIAVALQIAMGIDDARALDAAFRVRNSSISEFVFASKGSVLPGTPEQATERFSLSTFNETPHLQDAAQLTVR
jgi:broad specificity phosphatase PhoE